jgi:bla regulator protein BlaR1
MSLLLFASMFDVATSCFEELLLVSAIGGTVVVVGLLIQASISRFVSPKWMYVFWLLIAIRFLLFVVPASPTSLLNLFGQTSPIQKVDAMPEHSVTNHHVHVGKATNSQFAVMPYEHAKGSLPIGSAGWASGIWTTLISAWLLVLAVLLVRLLRGLLEIRRIVCRSSDPSAEHSRQYAMLRDQAKVRKSVELRITGEIDSPVSVGIFRQVILLPAWCTRELDSQQLDFVLAHELIHVRRRDGAKQLLIHLAATIHWFNPLVWLANRFAGRYLELSCDQQVLNQFSDDASNSINQKYRRTIAQVAIRCADCANSNQMQSALVGGFVSFDSKLVKNRIAMLSKKDSRSRASGFAIAGCLLCLFAIGYTDAQTLPQSPQQKESSPSETADRLPAIGETLPHPQLFQLGPKPVLPHGPIRLVVGKTSLVPATCELIGVSFDDPEVAAATIGEENELEFLAVVPGETIAHIELPGKRVQVKKIIAVPDVSDLQAAIERAFPGVVIRSYGTPEGEATITGNVENRLAAKIVAFAKTQTELPIKNMTTDKQHVAIKIWVYEVNTTKLGNAGIPASNTSVKPFLLVKHNGDAGGLNVGQIPGETTEQVSKFMESLAKRDVAKLLDQPVLIAAHRQKAEFLSGGEFPTVVLDENGNKKIDFRVVGTKLEITPQVRSKEELVLNLSAEFSKVDPELSPAEGVPGFRVRRIQIGLAAKPGSMIALVHDDEEDKELVILVKPKLIKLHDVDAVQPKFR